MRFDEVEINTRQLLKGSALLAGNVSAGGGWLPSGLAWGDDVKAIQGRLGKVEPDLCEGSEQSFYKSRGWSCEGVSKPGLRVSGTRFDVRLRMSERGYGLANINMLSRIDGTKSDWVGRASLMETCNAAQQVITGRLGEGTVTSEIVTGQAVRTMRMWMTPDNGIEVTVACLERPEADFGEVMIEFAPVQLKVPQGLI